MTKQFWTYKPETIAGMFGIGVRQVNRIYQKMRDCGIMDADGKIIYDESKHRDIIESQQRASKPQVMGVDAPSLGLQSPKSIPNSPMKTEFSKESIKEIIKESIKEDSKETIKKDKMAELLDDMITNTEDYKKEVSTEDIIKKAMDNNSEVVSCYNISTQKVGYVYYRSKSNIFLGVSEADYEKYKTILSV